MTQLTNKIFLLQALGNHEFDNGLSGLNPLLDEAKTPILCSNLVRDSNASAKIRDKVKSHVVVTRENRKIGIIGYLTADVIYLANTGKLSTIRVRKRN